MALGPLGVCFAMLGISILLEWLGVAESRQHRAPHRGGNGAMQANADLSWVSLSVAGDVANTRRWCCLCLCNGRSSRGGARERTAHPKQQLPSMTGGVVLPGAPGVASKCLFMYNSNSGVRRCCWLRPPRFSSGDCAVVAACGQVPEGVAGLAIRSPALGKASAKASGDGTGVVPCMFVPVPRAWWR